MSHQIPPFLTRAALIIPRPRCWDEAKKNPKKSHNAMSLSSNEKRK
jgi:hypothetical protein